MTGLAWLHSHAGGFQRTWSDSRQQSCGRILSVRGRILWQSCDLAPFAALPEPVSNWRLLLPRDFVVGSNPAGERMMITCGGLAIPFAYPEPGFVGWRTQSGSSTDGANQTRWSAKWSEVTIYYWLILVLLVLGPAEVFARRLFRRIKLARERSRNGREDARLKTETPTKFAGCRRGLACGGSRFGRIRGAGDR